MQFTGAPAVFGKHCKTAPLTLYLGLAILAAPSVLQAEESPATAPSAGVGDNGKRPFHIGRQPLYSALSSLAEQAGIQFVYAPDLVKGKTSAGVSGDYSTAEALHRVLEGSGLSYRVNGANTITLERRGDSPTSQNGGDADALPPMMVSGTAEYEAADPYNPSYRRLNATTATKTDTPIMETPFSVQVVPRAVMDDQNRHG